jgi:hypothetical protein
MRLIVEHSVSDVFVSVVHESQGFLETVAFGHLFRVVIESDVIAHGLKTWDYGHYGKTHEN